MILTGRTFFVIFALILASLHFYFDAHALCVGMESIWLALFVSAMVDLFNQKTEIYAGKSTVAVILLTSLVVFVSNLFQINSGWIHIAEAVFASFGVVYSVVTLGAIYAKKYVAKIQSRNDWRKVKVKRTVYPKNQKQKVKVNFPVQTTGDGGHIEKPKEKVKKELVGV
ncbi:MAG: hypothetical protein OEX08_02210 [Candidatus Nomurabacteria bacterium]|nr:hypothetical protein [Candidatus Nomurabacteria bacterium]